MATLENVKNLIGITSDFQDDTLQAWMDETAAFLEDAGVPAERQTDGIVARGVLDLWNYGAGDGKFSQYFMQRASQLALRK